MQFALWNNLICRKQIQKDNDAFTFVRRCNLYVALIRHRESFRSKTRNEESWQMGVQIRFQKIKTYKTFTYCLKMCLLLRVFESYLTNDADESLNRPEVKWALLHVDVNIAT